MAETGGPGPRPLNFVRVRLYRGGQAEFVLSVLEDERDALLEELGALRGDGGKLDGKRAVEIQGQLRHLINAIRDVQMGLIELVGGDGA